MKFLVERRFGGHWGRRGCAAVVAALMAGVVAGAVPGPAAAHPQPALPGSSFELDGDLLAGHRTPARDWDTLAEGRVHDPADIAEPDAWTRPGGEPGSPAGARGAPLGAGDLLTLGSHVEVTKGATFLHLFWRVRRSGMGRFDIELNRSVVGSSAPGRGGPVRRPGDVLISLDLSARVPAVGLFQWEGADRSRCAAFRAVPCWSRRSTLSRAGGVLAAVAFNDAPIAAAASDGLGPLPERTFAEASFDLSAFEPPGACFSFGSVTVTSRASGPFAREARDFIGPLPTLISTCAAGTPRPLQLAPS